MQLTLLKELSKLPEDTAIHSDSEDVAPNSSGMRAETPPSIALMRWNWGAMGFGWIWCLFHGMIAVGGAIAGAEAYVCFEGHVFLAVAMQLLTGALLALHGHQLAWRHRHYPGGVIQFFWRQRHWARFGVPLTILDASFAVAAFISSRGHL